MLSEVIKSNLHNTQVVRKTCFLFREKRNRVVTLNYYLFLFQCDEEGTQLTKNKLYFE